MLKYLLHRGKNNNVEYCFKNYLFVYLWPDYLCRIRRKSIINSLNTRSDKDYILSRVDYYCRLQSTVFLQEDKGRLADFSIKGRYNSVYFFDTAEHLKYFPKYLRWNYKFGDVTTLQFMPSIVKSRPIMGNYENSVLLNLDKVRHFVFLRDKREFVKKENKAIFRGKIYEKPHRIAFFERWFGDSACDIGAIAEKHIICSEWVVPKMTLYDHFAFKFVIFLEVNDVSSNLKWVMYSNSLAVMPKPTYETWFMEGKLIPNYHYVEIKSDYSDLKERMEYFIVHPDEAQEIIRHAHEWCEQFFDAEREKLISLLVLEKYFKMTGQSS